MRHRIAMTRPVRLALTLALVALAPALAPAQAPVTPPPKVSIAFNRLYDYPELVANFRRIAESHPDLVTLRSLGKSVEGRDLWCAIVSNRKTGDDRAKPAMYVDGNIHGNEVQAGEVALYLAWFLTEQYPRNEAIRKLLDERTFYIVPTVNPDGRAHWFNAPNTTHSSRSGKSPVDDDRDGVADEDGYEDVDGDGQVTQMRRRSDSGRFKPSSDDPRRLVAIKADERYSGPRYELLGAEGIDNDGDGRLNEDAAGGYDMNRNWPADWQPEHLQRGAGDYPLCWPETRAIADFLIDHPNVGGVVAFHNAAGMILRGPGHPSRQDQYPAGDDRLMETIGATGARLLPFYRNLVIHKDLYPVHGGFSTWTYEGLGIFSFTSELWNNDQLVGQPAAGGSTLDRAVGAVGEDAQLFADDRLLFGSSFRPWTPFDHPLYGPVEIGGFVKESQRVPPPFLIEEMCHRNAAFVLYHADQLPAVSWADVKVSPLAPGVHSVTATLRNERLIPTISEQASRRGIGLPDRATLAGEGLTVLAGGILRDRDTGELDPVRTEPARLRLEGGVPSLGTVHLRWIVRGGATATLTLESAKAGARQATVRIP
jgi:murein tripeptide amidase MpaA